ncbi:MAG: hypothetical protein WA434_19525 [Candidatus Acidiferrales bacterium]
MPHEAADEKLPFSGSGSSEFRARGSEMKSGKQGKFLRNVLVCSIAVLAIGFLGLGVRALEPAYITHLAFVGLFVVSIMSLVSYFLLRRPDQELAARPPSRTPLFIKLPIPPPHLSATSGNPLNPGLLPAKPALADLAAVKAGIYFKREN